MTIDIYERYYEAGAVFNGRERHGALVKLTSDSSQGNISYEASVSFFPHDTEEDFAVSYDACFSVIMYADKGRRSKKREEQLLEKLGDTIDVLAKENRAVVYWDKPLGDARRG